MLKLRPFQVTGAQFLADRPRAALLDQMGIGKSPQAIEAVKRLMLSNEDCILLIAPLATALGWEREVRRWWPDCPHHFTICRRRTPVPARGIVFIPWTDLAVRLNDLLGMAQARRKKFPVCIADEAHRIKGGTGVKMSKAFTGAWAKHNGSWVREAGVVDVCDRVWALTGTLLPNARPIEAMPLFIALGIIGNDRSACIKRKDYELQFCRQSNPWSPQGFDLMGRRNIDDLANLMRDSGVILRRTSVDVAGELPDLVRNIVPLGGITDVADPALKEAAAKLGPGELPPFDEMAAYRRDLGAVKAPAAAAWVIDHMDDQPADAAIVVFCHHKAVGEAIQGALVTAGFGAVEFASGDDSAAERQAKVDRFAAPTGPRAFVGTIDACGTGMNGLHLRTTECVFVECAWTPAALDQAEGRIRRMGGRGGAAATAVAHYLAAADCLDMHIVETVNDKRDVIWQALDTDEGGRASGAAAAPPPAPMPAPAPAAPLGPDSLPEPTDPSVHWSWTKDQRTGEWLVRNGHFLDASAQEAWRGAEITVTNRAGKAQVRRLVACIATGAHNGGWCIWSHADPESAGGRAKALVQRFHARMQRRARDAELVTALSDGGALTEADRPAVEACRAAARHLTALDADHAAKRNEEGWSQADVTVGRILADTDTAFWTQATLAGARAILRKYYRTQLPASLTAVIWPATAG